MGQRSSTATVVAIVQAFLEERSWKQASLARRIEIAVPALRKRLEELQAYGFPLEREEDHPHVWWSVPKSWFPGAVVFKDAEVGELLRLLARLPKSRSRDQVLESILRQLPARGDMAALVGTAIVPPDASGPSERYQSVLEDAAAQRIAVRVRYFSAGRGAEGARHLSVHRVVIGPPARIIATCHRSGTLKWFRIDNVFEARLDEHEPFRPAAPADVATFHDASLDGFHQDGPTEVLSFFVRDPEARWVARNLLPGMRHEETDGGIRVTAETTAILQVARYLAGLGEAARPESPRLASCVLALAEGTLRSARARAND